MRVHAVLSGLALAVALSIPAAAGESSGWSSILSDFFLGPQVREEFQWAGLVPAGQTLEIKGVNGAVHARPAAGDRVEVQASKRGRRSAPSSVRVEVVEHGGGVTVCAVYPTSGGSRSNECLPGPKGRIDARNSDVVVDFTVKVPAGVHFVGTTVNGAVEVAGLGADVDVRTVNGGIAISTNGNARAETVNGSITASMGRADWKETALFETVNGGIEVTLPGNASTTLHAETVNGSLATDFVLSGASVSKRKLSGTIGEGGRGLALETVNGSIQVRRTP